MKKTTGAVLVLLTWAFASTVFRNTLEPSILNTFIAWCNGAVLLMQWVRVRREYQTQTDDIMDKIAGDEDKWADGMKRLRDQLDDLIRRP